MSSSRKEFVDIWAIAQEEKKKKDTEKDTTDSAIQLQAADESHIFIIGSSQGGKTSLILNFLERDEAPKPTNVLEYTYGRKSRGANLAKDVCHIWELGGGTSLLQLIDIPLTQHTISHFHLLIIVDLSKPDQLWDTIEILVNQVRKRINEIMSEMKSVSPKLMKTLKSRAIHRYGNDHPDKDLVTPLLVPTAIIGTKYDLFQEFDPEKKKIISKTLRFLAHTLGASLMYCSNRSDLQFSRVQQFISHFAFNTSLSPINRPHPIIKESRLFIRYSNSISMDHNKPITVPVGCDALGQIGAPTLSSSGDLDKISAKSPFDLWRQAFTGFFSQKSQDSAVDDPCKDKKYSETTIDTLRHQKDDELQRYIRDYERKEKQREARLLKTTPTK